MPRDKNNPWNKPDADGEYDVDDQEMSDNSFQAFRARNAKIAKKPPRHLTVKQLLGHGQNMAPGQTFADPSFEELFKKGYFSELVWELRSGKEATVYVVRGNLKSSPQNPDALLAAKLYVDSRVRSFSKTGVYAKGRVVGNERLEKAIDQGSKFGIGTADVLWTGEEFKQLHSLYRAGIAVPRPVATAGHCVLMEFIGEENEPAPRISDAGLDKEEIHDALEQSLIIMGRMLALGKVHGDFSAFNLLWKAGKVIAIDFPQLVEWDKNPNAKAILERDFEGLSKTFSPLGAKMSPLQISQKVWAIAKENRTEYTPETS